MIKKDKLFNCKNCKGEFDKEEQGNLLTCGDIFCK